VIAAYWGRSRRDVIDVGLDEAAKRGLVAVLKRRDYSGVDDVLS